MSDPVNPKQTVRLCCLQDALTLVAHNNPADCPSYQQLLGEEAHSQLAAAVNAAVLKHLGRPESSCLETLIRQLVSSSKP